MLKLQTLYFLLVCVFFCACNNSVQQKKIDSEKNETTKNKPKKDSLTIIKEECKKSLEWVKENAIKINPNSLTNLHTMDYEQKQLYQLIDEQVFFCLFGRDSVKVQSYTYCYYEKPDEIIIHNLQYQPYKKLCDVYLDSLQNIKGFTFFNIDGGGHERLYYASVNPKEQKVKAVAEIAYNWGDAGAGWNESSVWLSKNLLQKNLLHSYFGVTIKQSTIKIRIEDNGEITFLEPNIIVALSEDEANLIYKQKSEEFFGTEDKN